MPKRRPKLQKTYTNEHKKKSRVTYKSPTFNPSMAPVPVEYLNPVQKFYLLIVAKYVDELGRFPYQREVAEKLGVTQQAIAHVLKGLVIRGWVMRVNKFRWALVKRLPRDITLEDITEEYRNWNVHTWRKHLVSLAGSTPKHTNTKIFLDKPEENI